MSEKLQALNFLKADIEDVVFRVKDLLLDVGLKEIVGDLTRIKAGLMEVEDKRVTKTGLYSATVPVLIMAGEGVDSQETEKITLTRENTPGEEGGLGVIRVNYGDRSLGVVVGEEYVNGWEIYHFNALRQSSFWTDKWLNTGESIKTMKNEHLIDMLGIALFKEGGGSIQLVLFPIGMAKGRIAKAFSADGWLKSAEVIENRQREILAQMTPLEVWQEDPKIFFNNLWDFIHDPKKTDGKEEMRRVNLGIAGISGEAHLSQGKILLKVYGASRIAFDRQNGKVEQAYGAVDRQNLEIYLMQSEISDGGIALICSTINPKEPKKRYPQIMNQGQINSLINLFGKLRPY
ncbi:hypothetical protein L6272_05090 [Microgenomates group bacterium]|nr:hypothetical protein [Microgenomates group bacterium]